MIIEASLGPLARSTPPRSLRESGSFDLSFDVSDVSTPEVYLSRLESAVASDDYHTAAEFLEPLSSLVYANRNNLVHSPNRSSPPWESHGALGYFSYNQIYRLWTTYTPKPTPESYHVEQLLRYKLLIATIMTTHDTPQTGVDYANYALHGVFPRAPVDRSAGDYLGMAILDLNFIGEALCWTCFFAEDIMITRIAKLLLDYRAFASRDAESDNAPLVRCSPNYSLSTGHTPLLLAVRAGNVKLVNLFLEHGADPTYMPTPRIYYVGEECLFTTVVTSAIAFVRQPRENFTDPETGITIMRTIEVGRAVQLVIELATNMLSAEDVRTPPRPSNMRLNFR